MIFRSISPSVIPHSLRITSGYSVTITQRNRCQSPGGAEVRLLSPCWTFSIGISIPRVDFQDIAESLYGWTLSLAYSYQIVPGGFFITRQCYLLSSHADGKYAKKSKVRRAGGPSLPSSVGCTAPPEAR